MPPVVRRRAASSAVRRAASLDARRQGVITGAAIGSVSGAIIAANNTRPAGWCTYRDRYTGQDFYARCP